MMFQQCLHTFVALYPTDYAGKNKKERERQSEMEADGAPTIEFNSRAKRATGNKD